jgi:tetratricopeptide (TPR) repeat protein
LVRKKEYDKAIAFYDTAIDIYINNNNFVRYVRTLNSRAQAKIRQQKFSEAEKDLIKANEIGEEIHCTRDLCVVIGNFGFLYHGKNDDEGYVYYAKKMIDLSMDMNELFSFVVANENYYMYEHENGKCSLDVIVMIMLLYKRIGFKSKVDEMYAYVRDFNDNSIGLIIRDVDRLINIIEFRDLRKVSKLIKELASCT